MNFDIK